MTRCGICNGLVSNTMVKHGQICEDDRKAPARPYLINNNEGEREQTHND